MRWKRGQRGRYEGWYVAFNHPESGRGFWVRYSLRAPTDQAEDSHCQLWYMRTDRGADPRNLALRETYPIERLSTTGRPFRLEVGAGRLTMDGCSGQISQTGREVEWNLSFESSLPPITPTPEWGARLATCYLEPHPLLRVTGTVKENGATVDVDGWLGEQAHVFGVRHSTRWHWAECKHLGGPGRAFVGVAAWPSLPGPARPVTSLFLDLGDGRRLLRNRTLDLFKPSTEHSPDGWAFSAEYGRDRLEGSVTPRREDLIGVTYRDPGGDRVYCYHSELADLNLRLFARPSRSTDWRLVEEIIAPGASTFEYGSATPLSGVPLLLD